MLGTHHVSSKIDAEDGNSSEWKRNIEQDEGEEGGDFGNVGGEGVGDGFLQIVEDETAFLYSGDN